MARYLISVPDHARLEAFMLLNRIIERGDKMPCAYAIGDNHYHLHATKTGISMACYAAAKPEAPAHD